MTTTTIPHLQIALGHRTPIDAETLEIVWREHGVDLVLQVVCDDTDWQDLVQTVGAVQRVRIPFDGDDWICDGYITSLSEAECLDGGLLRAEICITVAQGRMPPTLEQDVEQNLEQPTVLGLPVNYVKYEDLLPDVREYEIVFRDFKLANVPIDEVCGEVVDDDDVPDVLDWTRILRDE